MTALRFIYTANIFIAGWISLSTLFFPEEAQFSIFEGIILYSEAYSLIGVFWTGILVISVFGLFYPKNMSLILLFQFIFKLAWLVLAALPAITNNQPFPKAMTAFFLIWVIVLPFIIPWKYLFEKS